MTSTRKTTQMQEIYDDVLNAKDVEINRLRAALEPFAAFADEADRSNVPDWMCLRDVRGTLLSPPTVGDCRKAREAREGESHDG